MIKKYINKYTNKNDISILKEYLKENKNIFDYSFNFYDAKALIIIKGKNKNLIFQEIINKLNLNNINYNEAILKYNDEWLADVIIK